VHLGIFERLSTLWQVLTLAQDVEKKKCGAKDSAFFSLNEDIVAWSQDEKCGICNSKSGVYQV
jgi:hypothetical protein